MKKQMFALLAMVSTFMGVSIQAGEWDCNDCDGKFYIGGFAGANFLQDSKLKTGFTGGASLGYQFQNNLRLEGEFAYRRNHTKSYSFNHNVVDGDNVIVNREHGKVSLQTYSAMANIVYDFDLGCELKPYIGAGVGYGWNKVSVSSHDVGVSYDKGGFAYQGIAGIAYSVCNQTNIGIEYRYFHVKSDIKDHAVALSLRRGF